MEVQQPRSRRSLFVGSIAVAVAIAVIVWIAVSRFATPSGEASRELLVFQEIASSLSVAALA